MGVPPVPLPALSELNLALHPRTLNPKTAVNAKARRRKAAERNGRDLNRSGGASPLLAEDGWFLESFASFYASALKESLVFAALIPILLYMSIAQLSGRGGEEHEE